MLVYSSSGTDRRMKEQGREESKAASTKDAVTGGSRGQLVFRGRSCCVYVATDVQFRYVYSYHRDGGLTRLVYEID